MLGIGVICFLLDLALVPNLGSGTAEGVGSVVGFDRACLEVVRSSLGRFLCVLVVCCSSEEQEGSTVCFRRRLGGDEDDEDESGI